MMNYALPIAVGIASACLRDLMSYRTAVNADPTKPFRVDLFFVSIAIGALTGFLGAAGVSLAE